MRRALIAVGIACLVLGVLTPAQAEDPVEEQTPMWGGECLNSQNLPAASSDHQYLQSYFSVTCNAYSGYSIIRMHTDAKYSASPGAGVWNQYSNGINSKGNGVNGPTGTITYNLLRDTCHWGGDWNYYRRVVTLDVTFYRFSTGTQYVDTRTFYRTTGSRIPCGDHE